MRNKPITLLVLFGLVGGCDTATEPSPGSCTYVAVPAEFTPCMSAPDELALDITTAATCSWSAGTTVPWLTLLTSSQGRGSSTLRYRIADNWDAPRLGLITIRGGPSEQGLDVRVAQAGCRYGLSQSSMNLPALGGTYFVEVLQQSEPLTCGGPLQNACAWSAVADVTWIQITTPMPKTGDSPVSFTVAANNDVTARTGTITVRDQVLRVTQPGR